MLSESGLITSVAKRMSSEPERFVLSYLVKLMIYTDPQLQEQMTKILVRVLISTNPVASVKRLIDLL